MPFRKVKFLNNYYYHIYNRGSEKRIIFSTNRDYQNFLKRIKDNIKKFNIEMLCYCLMPNHFHFLLKQITNSSVINFMNSIQLGYAKYFNTKYQRVGPLFQGRFKAKIIETDEYLLQLSAYIHNNPIAKLDSRNPADSRNRLHNYPYSSYSEYIGKVKSDISLPSFILSYFSKSNPNLTYESFVEGFDPDYEVLAPLILE